MSAYLKFFELNQSPFERRAQSQVVLGTRALREAFAAIQDGLEEGTSRLCVNGGAGLGKTSLARALPKLLDDRSRVALIPDAAVPWQKCRGAVARQWGLESGGLARAGLIEAASQSRLVLTIDQAEHASEEFLDHLDVLLSYRTEDDRPVVQSVLFARLSREAGEAPAPLLWWLDRIQTLQLEFAPLPREGVESYLHKNLKRAGWSGPPLFDGEAAGAIHEQTGGIPGQIALLCEKILIEAAARELTSIDAAFIHQLCDGIVSEVDPEPRLHAEKQKDSPEASSGTRADQTEAKSEPHASAIASDDAGAGLNVQNESASEPEAVCGGDSRVETEPETPFDTPASTFEAALEFFGSASSGQTVPAEPRDEENVVCTETETHEDDEEDEGIACEEPESDSPPSAFDEETAVLAFTPDESDPAGDDSDDSDQSEDEVEYEDYGYDPPLLPPTPEELAQIRGSALSRFAQPLAAAALAALVGGIGFTFLSGPDDEPEPDPSQAESTRIERSARNADIAPTARLLQTAAPQAPPSDLFAPTGGFVEVRSEQPDAGESRTDSQAEAGTDGPTPPGFSARNTPRGEARAEQTPESLPASPRAPFEPR